MDAPAERLPIHGFVLAGGMSTRMGQDKALMAVRGRPMVELAVETLRSFCAAVSIAGNRDDLAAYAPVVREARVGIGPVTGIEAGLRAAEHPWVIFVPVDVPLMPAEVLQSWAAASLGLAESGLAASCLMAGGIRQPAFCLFRADCLSRISAAIDAGKRRLNELVDAAGDGRSLWIADAARFGADGKAAEVEVERWFANVNTPEELAVAERWAGSPGT